MATLDWLKTKGVFFLLKTRLAEQIAGLHGPKDQLETLRREIEQLELKLPKIAAPATEDARLLFVMRELTEHLLRRIDALELSDHEREALKDVLLGKLMLESLMVVEEPIESPYETMVENL